MEPDHRDPYQLTFETYNNVAQAYNEKFLRMDIYNQTYDLFCEMLPAGSSVVDIGCGPGNISHYIISKRKDIKVYGIDVAEEMVALARFNNPTAEFELLDCRDIDKLDRSFYGAVCGFCIPYLAAEDCIKLFADLSDMLHPDGVLYLSFVEGDYERSGYQTSKAGTIYFYYHSADYIGEVLTQNQFTLEHVRYINYDKSDGLQEIHTVFIARKTAVNL